MQTKESMQESDIQPWAWQPDLCPADQDFIEWFKRSREHSLNIFHMGPGVHHKVGLSLSDDNSVVSVTLSPAEVTSYISLCTQDPYLSIGYTCLYGDIHYLNWDAFRPFDIVTLFHLCEIQTTNGFTRLHSKLLTHTKIDSWVIGYRQSANASQAQAYLNEWFEKTHEFKSLDFYRKK